MLPFLKYGFGLVSPWIDWPSQENSYPEDSHFSPASNEEATRPRFSSLATITSPVSSEDVALPHRDEAYNSEIETPEPEEEDPLFCTREEYQRIQEIFDSRWFVPPYINPARLRNSIINYPMGTFAITATQHPKYFGLHRNVCDPMLNGKTRISLLRVDKSGELILEGRTYKNMFHLISWLHLVHPINAYETRLFFCS